MMNHQNDCTEGGLRSEMRSEMRPDPTRFSLTSQTMQHVLLTGGTGFLGIHLLYDLMVSTEAKVYCLVRGKNEQEIAERMAKLWDFYFANVKESFSELLNDRLVLVAGNVAEVKLGMLPAQYEQLCGLVDTVIHSAADVRHFGLKAHFEKINIAGTAHVISFCLAGKSKRLHHMSTLSVSGDIGGIYTEFDFDRGQDFYGEVYSYSKFEAEKLVFEARKQGLLSSVYRIGHLVGRYSDGVFQSNIDSNRYYNSMKAIIVLQKTPHSSLPQEVELTPIDCCSQAIIKLISHQDFIGHTYHITNPYFIRQEKLIQFLQQLGYTIQITSDEQFYSYIHDLMNHSELSEEMLLLLHALQDDLAFEIESDLNDDVAEMEHIQYDCAFTLAALRQVGFTWPTIDYEYFARLMAHNERVNYFSSAILQQIK
ncbi:SDR family oxidoreductase [Paenibacillus sp. 481]|uniref:SDR family oxidoreductase n=1 Tax=Paenibacillus sp. 481 TaxID=2835869 RepID=UPI001E2987F8|nr:SDR family oxidoreductase [Paenibacillus sp. 481]UHA73618.1 SDR family oxidoreductase [Paenibacillus sp. 481]